MAVVLGLVFKVDPLGSFAWDPAVSTTGVLWLLPVFAFGALALQNPQFS